MTDNKKVLIVDEKLPFLLNQIPIASGGAAVQSLNWLIGFKKNNLKVAVFSNARIDNKSDIEVLSAIDNYKETKNFKLFIKISNTYKIVKQYAPNYIYISIPGWHTIIWGIICKLLNITYIQRISNNFMVDNRFVKTIGRLRYTLFVLGISLSDIILCQNEYQYYNIKNKYSNKYILKVYNPFNIPPKKLYPREGKYVAWIGLFQNKKNLDALLKITKQLLNYSFKIVGESDGNLDEISQQALHELQTMNNVEFVGVLSRDEIIDFLASSYCLLNTSYYEGFSNTFLEAIYVGTPIITLQVNDPDHIIEQNNLGIVTLDYESMPEQIIRLILTGKDMYKKLGRSYIKQNHDPEKLVKELLLFIEFLKKNNKYIF